MSVNNKLSAKIEALKNSGSFSQTAEVQEQQEGSLEWNRTSIDFGVVAPGSKQDYSFTYIGNKKISSVKGSCSCTSTLQEGNKVSGVLVVANDFSYSKEKFVELLKTVTVHFDDSSMEVLTLECTVNKNLNIQ